MPEVPSFENGMPCWIDIGVPDIAAAGAFYSALFGWEIEYGPEEIGFYSMCRIGGRDVAAIGAQQAPGMVVWATYLSVDDLDASVAKVESAGGSIIVPPMDVMTFGRMAIIADPGGAVVSLWQKRDHAGVGMMGEPGSMCWNELMTRHVDESLAFYREVFGLEGRQADLDDSGYVEFFAAGGHRVGGLMPMVGETWPAEIPDHWMVYFAVDDPDATAARCIELGGQAPVPPTDIPPGRFAVLNDPFGGHFSILRLDPRTS